MRPAWTPTHTINHRANGIFAGRVGEPVQWLEPGANHLHAKVCDAGGKRLWLPTGWLTEIHMEES